MSNTDTIKKQEMNPGATNKGKQFPFLINTSAVQFILSGKVKSYVNGKRSITIREMVIS